MFKIDTEKELLESFRSIDQDQVQIPSELKFPLPVKNYFSWLEPSGHRAYLVFENPESRKNQGIVFRRTPVTSENFPSMCDWCHSVRGRNGISMMTAAVSRDRQVGIYLCSDLKCGEQISKPPGVNDLRETLSASERLQALLQRMSDFSRKNLF
jgi:hypothetical protein